MPKKPPPLDLILEPEIPADGSVSEESQAEVIDWDARAKAEAVRQLQIENAQRGQDLRERRKYAGRIFGLILCWLIAVLLLLILQGFSIYGFRLSDGVLLMTVGTTTGSVLGIFLIVANYLFPKR